MDNTRIGIGVAALFLGIIVPVYHHVALHAAVAHQPTNNIVIRMHSVFEWLPWIDWLYLGLMIIVGMILIGSGLRRRPPGRSE